MIVFNVYMLFFVRCNQWVLNAPTAHLDRKIVYTAKSLLDMPLGRLKYFIKSQAYILVIFTPPLILSHANLTIATTLITPLGL